MAETHGEMETIPSKPQRFLVDYISPGKVSKGKIQSGSFRAR
jgi:hypothetical protein